MPDHLILVGDFRREIEALPDESIDAVVTDPPYELGFMGKSWDSTGIAFDPTAWALILQKMKPGAHLCAFGAPRNYHRLAVAIEDAGFEIRDSILGWLFGTGFPKSFSIGKAIAKERDDREEILRVTAAVREARDAAGLTNADLDGLFGFQGMAGHWTTAASQPQVPTLEQWAVLRERLPALAAADALVEHLNGRKTTPGEGWTEAEIVGEYATPPTMGLVGRDFQARDNLIRALPPEAAAWESWGTALKPAYEPIVLARKPMPRIDGQKLPAYKNVQRFGTGAINVGACMVPADPAAGKKAGSWPTNLLIGESAAEELGEKAKHFPFFYHPKVARAERDAGLEGFRVLSGAEMTDREEGEAGLKSPRAGAGRGGGMRNNHPTVKPISVMRWLVRLVTPPGGLVLDPFAGSGSTGCAAALEGFDFVGCEMDPHYAAIADARISHWKGRAAA